MRIKNRIELSFSNGILQKKANISPLKRLSVCVTMEVAIKSYKRESQVWTGISSRLLNGLRNSIKIHVYIFMKSEYSDRE